MDGEQEITVIGVGFKPVQENQPPLVSTDKGSLYATGNIIVLQRRDLPKLFSENQIKSNGNDDIIFVPDDVVMTWVGRGDNSEKRNDTRRS